MAEQRPADDKRAKISKAQRVTLAEVLVASLVLGACLVVSNFLIQYISFNTKVITAKNEAIQEYDTTLLEVGVCQDKDKNGKLSDKELADCNADETRVEDVRDSLRFNIYRTMAQNIDLESVARKRNQDGVCYEDDGRIKDFSAAYDQAKNDAEREQALQGMKVCSALRVIPDALPAHKNTEALMASLNQLFILSAKEPESIAPQDDTVGSGIEGIEVIPVTFRVEGSDATILEVLDNIEHSVREFDITSALIEWNTSGLSLRADANAYYLADAAALEAKATLRANSKTGAVVKSELDEEKR